MKTYQVVLAKNYLVTIKAENKEQARRMCELYTGDIQPLSTLEDMEREKFSFEDIECTINETFDCQKIED